MPTKITNQPKPILGEIQFATRPLSQFQADLCDMQALDDVSVEKKTGAEVSRAFASILGDGGTPETLQSDANKEYFNATFAQLMKKHSTIDFSTRCDLKASMVECFNHIF